MEKPLAALVQRARDVRVRDDHARAYVDELARWGAAAERPRRSWVPWLAAGVAFAAAILLLVFRRDAAAPLHDDPIALGERVAILAEPATRYRVERATVDETVVEVERGTVTARLWPGTATHRLVLRGGAIEAVATGTVYSLTVDDAGASVAVHEGTVAVTGGATVTPGHPWPASSPARGAASARVLLAAEQPPTTPTIVVDAPPPPPPPDAMPADAAPRLVVDARPAPAVVPPDAPPDAAAVPLNERWRLARLYRGQGNYAAAIAECLAMADAHDGTWSPIALVEAMRIELGPRTSPERALVLADRFVREWPAHDLAAEARELRCRALRQLGRGTECAAP